MEKKKHWTQIDSLYLIGFVLVLIGHSHSSDLSKIEGTIMQSAIHFLYSFHMGLFFFVAGFLFQNSTSLERSGYGKWVWDKALRLLTPYLFWTLIALVPKYYLEHHSFGGLTPAYVLETIFLPRNTVWGHFWFIPVLFFTYVIFGLWRLLQNKDHQKVHLIVAVLIAAGISFLPIKIKILGLSDLKSNLVFFALGMLFRYSQLAERFDDAVRKRPGRQLLAAAAAAAGIAGSILLLGFDEAVPEIRLVIAILMIAVCWIVAELIPVNWFSTWVGQHNFTFYIFSWFFQAAVMMVCDRLHVSWQTTFLGMFVAGFAGPLLLTLLCEKMPIMKKKLFQLIFGLRS